MDLTLDQAVPPPPPPPPSQLPSMQIALAQRHRQTTMNSFSSMASIATASSRSSNSIFSSDHARETGDINSDHDTQGQQTPTSVASHASRLSRKTPLHHRRDSYMSLSEEMRDELDKYRYTILLLMIALLYAIIAFASVAFTPAPTFESSDDSEYKLKHVTFISDNITEDVGWTQEMIAGWHRERPLVTFSALPTYLASNTSTLNDTYQNGTIVRNMLNLHNKLIRVRECKSKTQQQQQIVTQLLVKQRTQLDQQLKTQASIDNLNKSLIEAAQVIEVTSQKLRGANDKLLGRRPHRRMFQAFNGCLFRRVPSSDSMGDLCCCAGPPQFVWVRKSKTRTRKRKKSTTTSVPQHDHIANETSKVSAMVRNYTRPQIICFKSNAASLFNMKQLEAPVANENNLKNAFIKNKGRCITCSCCHEHEPELVNKLLSNVQLHPRNPKSGKSGLASYERLKSAKDDVLDEADLDFDDEDPRERKRSVWLWVRDKLVNAIKSMDDMFFSIYDLIDMIVYQARHGDYPNNLTSSTHYLLLQNAVIRPSIAEYQTNVVRVSDRANLKPQLEDLRDLEIDDDVYDPFTTSTTSSTTTTTPSTITATTTTTTNTPSTTSPPADTTTTISPSTTSSPNLSTTGAEISTHTSSPTVSSAHSTVPARIDTALEDSSTARVTSSSPSTTRRPKRKRKKYKTISSTTTTTTSTSTTVEPSVVQPIESDQQPTSGPLSRIAAADHNATALTTSTTKNPTVVINFYANNNNPDLSKHPMTQPQKQPQQDSNNMGPTTSADSARAVPVPVATLGSAQALAPIVAMENAVNSLKDTTPHNVPPSLESSVKNQAQLQQQAHAQQSAASQNVAANMPLAHNLNSIVSQPPAAGSGRLSAGDSSNNFELHITMANNATVDARAQNANPDIKRNR